MFYQLYYLKESLPRVKLTNLLCDGSDNIMPILTSREGAYFFTCGLGTNKDWTTQNYIKKKVERI
jgi:hypothetical protein